MMNYQYRITYKKTEGLRYTSNLDVHKIWERSFRRSDLSLAYSQGFHPQPKIQQASPLPLGFLSDYELVDFYLTEEQDPFFLKELIQKNTPTGFEITQIEPILEKQPALQVQVNAAEYKIEFLDAINTEPLVEKINNLLTQESIPRTRRNKQYDLRPLILELELIVSEQPILKMRLKSEQGATGRPEEVLDELNLNLEDTRITRTMICRTNTDG